MVDMSVFRFLPPAQRFFAGDVEKRKGCSDLSVESAQLLRKFKGERHEIYLDDAAQEVG
jgi:hypothetical protein